MILSKILTRAAVIVDGGDQSPLFLGKGGPAVGGTIMLDQGADGSGQDLPVVGFLLPSGLMTAQLFSSINDGVQ